MPGPIVVGMIPARFASTRLPGKALAPIRGVSLIERVYRRASAASVLDLLFVATDDERIVIEVEDFDGQAVMTSTDHASGTDRLVEAFDHIERSAMLAPLCPEHGSGADPVEPIIVNIQGDQPFIDPRMIEEVVEPLLADPALEMATLMRPIERADDLADPGVVKVVTDRAGNALYFSRSLIPYPQTSVAHRVFEHVGLYAYRASMLRRFASLPPSIHEQVESLEQLRVLENGHTIRVVETSVADSEFAGFSVDTAADLARAERMLTERGLA